MHHEPPAGIVQISLLRALGFLPCSRVSKRPVVRSPFRTHYRLILCFASKLTAWFILGGASLLASIRIANSSLKVFNSAFTVFTVIGTSQNAIVKLLNQVPGIAIQARSVLILLLFYTKRKPAAALFHELSAILDKDLLLKEQVCRRAKKIAIGLLTLSVIFHIGYPVTSDFLPVFTTENETIWSPAGATPFYLGMVKWQWLCFVLFLRGLSFILSQQVYLVIVLVCVVLYDCLKQIVGGVAAAQQRLDCGVTIDFTAFEIQVENWRIVYGKIADLVDKIDALFGSILLVAYCLDWLVVLGTASWFLTMDLGDPNLLSHLRLPLTCVSMFGVYVTLLPLPFVAVHEKVRD